MEKTVKVSVLLPVYNGEKYLQRAIDSVLAQTFKDYEVIVIDDGSTDWTPRILRAYENNPRFKIVHQKNQGVAEALNVALSLARGEYVATISHDDFWLPHKLETEIEAMESCGSEVGVVYSNYYNFYEETGKREPIRLEKEVGPFSRELVLRLCPANIGSATIRRSVLMRLQQRDGFICDPNLSLAMDWDLWIRLSRFCDFKHIPDFLSCYSIHPNRISGSWKHIRQHLTLYSRWNGFDLNFFIHYVLRAYVRRFIPNILKKPFKRLWQK